jgi:hypothetical protein
VQFLTHSFTALSIVSLVHVSGCRACKHSAQYMQESLGGSLSCQTCMPAQHTQVLDLCSDDELESVYDLLHAPSPFSPVVKSLVAESEPALLGLRGRVSQGAVLCQKSDDLLECKPGWVGW